MSRFGSVGRVIVVYLNLECFFGHGQVCERRMYDCFVWSIYVHICSYLRHISLHRFNMNARAVIIRPYQRFINSKVTPEQ